MDLKMEEEQILGIGFSFPGLVSALGDEITYGKNLDCTGLKIQSIQKYIDYPCRLLHDADAAARSERWASPEVPDFVFLNISQHLGAALIHHQQIVAGKHGYAATLEHMQMVPGGKLCYCGKRGCIETLCSMSAFLEGDNEEAFFEALRSGDPDIGKRWDTYLSHLARAILHTQLVCDRDVILGGYLAAYVQEEDVEKIYDEMERITPFQVIRDFIRISKRPKHGITIGAGLPYIQEFLDGAFEGRNFAALPE
jgi:predicted NBD/HSP70 family sugar kinase